MIILFFAGISHLALKKKAIDKTHERHAKIAAMAIHMSSQDRPFWDGLFFAFLT